MLLLENMQEENSLKLTERDCLVIADALLLTAKRPEMTATRMIEFLSVRQRIVDSLQPKTEEEVGA